MGIIVPLNFANAVIRWGLTGDPEPMVCTLGLAGLIGMSPEEIATEVFEDLTTSGSLCAATNMSTAYQLQGVTVYLQTETGFAIGAHDDVVQGAGNVTPLPSNCAYLVRKSTGQGGRRNRGRMFLPPFMDIEANVSPTGSILGSFVALQARLDTFYNNLTTDVDGDALVPVLFHSDGSSPTVITGLALQNIIATQRTRMRG